MKPSQGLFYDGVTCLTMLLQPKQNVGHINMDKLHALTLSSTKYHHIEEAMHNHASHTANFRHRPRQVPATTSGKVGTSNFFPVSRNNKLLHWAP